MQRSLLLHKMLRWGCGVMLLAFCMSIAFALYKTDKDSIILPSMVLERLQESGVENPVTAVLLNFRSFDTLLEIAVLLIVATAIATAPGSNRGVAVMVKLDSSPSTIDPIVFNAIKFLAPITILVSGYLLWTGAYAPGGAFQAGSMLAGIFIFMSLCGLQWFVSEKVKRGALVSGLLVFCLVGVMVMLPDQSLLEYPVKYATSLILIIEMAATLSIATALLVLYASLRSDDAAK